MIIGLLPHIHRLKLLGVYDSTHQITMGRKRHTVGSVFRNRSDKSSRSSGTSSSSSSSSSKSSIKPVSCV